MPSRSGGPTSRWSRPGTAGPRCRRPRGPRSRKRRPPSTSLGNCSHQRLLGEPTWPVRARKRVSRRPSRIGLCCHIAPGPLGPCGYAACDRAAGTGWGPDVRPGLDAAGGAAQDRALREATATRGGPSRLLAHDTQALDPPTLAPPRAPRVPSRAKCNHATR